MWLQLVSCVHDVPHVIPTHQVEHRLKHSIIDFASCIQNVYSKRKTSTNTFMNREDLRDFIRVAAADEPLIFRLDTNTSKRPNSLQSERQIISGLHRHRSSRMGHLTLIRQLHREISN